MVGASHWTPGFEVVKFSFEGFPWGLRFVQGLTIGYARVLGFGFLLVVVAVSPHLAAALMCYNNMLKACLLNAGEHFSAGGDGASSLCSSADARGRIRSRSLIPKPQPDPESLDRNPTSGLMARKSGLKIEPSPNPKPQTVSEVGVCVGRSLSGKDPGLRLSVFTLRLPDDPQLDTTT